MHRPLLVILVTTTVSTLACSPPTDRMLPRTAPGTTFTASELAKLGAANAWDALQRAGLNLTFKETRRGIPERITRTRGWDVAAGSDTLADQRRAAGSRMTEEGVVIILDGSPTWDVSVLRDISVASIESLRVVHRRSDMPLLIPGGRHASAIITISTRRAKY